MRKIETSRSWRRRWNYDNLERRHYSARNMEKMHIYMKVTYAETSITLVIRYKEAIQ